MIGFIGTSLRLQSIITAQTLSSFWMNYDCCLRNAVWRISRIHGWTPFYNCQKTEQRLPPLRVPLLLIMNVLSWKRAWTVAYQTDNSMSGPTIPAFRWWLPSRCLANGLSDLFSRKRVLVSRCLALDYSGFQASCHSMYVCMYVCMYVYVGQAL
jgi:hypothetical protein